MPHQPFEETQEARRKGRGDFRDLKKHYVRVNGWLPAFRRHCTATGGQVRYLTFCAKEAIDVRYFAQKGVLIRNASANEYPTLTFVESDEEDYATIAETLGRVRLAIHADFESLLLDSSHPRHRDLVTSFPYHVINLDFCGHIVPRSDHPYSTTLRCIHKVVELQANSSAKAWHLFLTFRAQRTHANDEANAQLRDMLESNLTRGEFREAYGTRAAPAALLDSTYQEFLRVSIGKVLAHAARNQGYRVQIESSWLYSRQEGSYHIVKLVAELESLRNVGALPNPPREDGAYIGAVRGIFRSRAKDIDNLTPAQRSVTARELRPVLEELSQQGIVLS